ncbi:MAG: hypothetical protein ACRDDY_19290 [Clostridium sp.]|uniref:hypothetical protein n=1 Tax=Clostridium sp. TaxID=1506 RepID=UPI003EE5ED4A
MSLDYFTLKSLELSYFLDIGIAFSLASDITSVKANQEARKQLLNYKNYIPPNNLLYLGRYYSFCSAIVTYIFIVKTLHLLTLNPSTTTETINRTIILLKIAFTTLYTSYIALGIAYSLLNT